MLGNETEAAGVRRSSVSWGSARAGRRFEEAAWSIGERARANALRVAQRLLKLEAVGDLSYRGVPLEVDAVDVTPCSGSHPEIFYRYYLLRLATPLPQDLPGGHGTPLEWRSEVLILPRTQGGGMMTRLATFEAEFAVRSFLRTVEREIDIVLARSGEIGGIRLGH